MRGAEEIIAARLAGMPVRSVVIDRLREPPVVRWPSLEAEAGEVVGRVEVYDADTVASLDLRCCHGLKVLIFAQSYGDWPIAVKAMDCEPSELTFAAPEFAAHFDGERLQAWEL